MKPIFLQEWSYEINYDVSKFVNASIDKVMHTLVEAFVLVAVVVFIFLGDWRSTLIPTMAVPVSLIGAFIFMQIFGLTINLITLFALVLAIGIVVDNAIVVVEAVHTKMEEEHLYTVQGGEESIGRNQWCHHRDYTDHDSRVCSRCFHDRTCWYFLQTILHHDGQRDRTLRCCCPYAYTRTLRDDPEKPA